MSGVNASFAKLLEYEQLARGNETPTPGDAQQTGDWAGLAFAIRNTRLVCTMDVIQESLPLPSITRVPGTKPFILGLANVRGELVTVVDLGCFLHGKPSTPSMQTRVLSASLRGRPVGLMVDEVHGQRNFMSSDASEPELGNDSPLAGLVNKQHRSGSETWQELDLETLFETPDFLDGAAA